MSTTTALPQLFSYGHALEMADDKVGLLRDSRDAMDDVRRFKPGIPSHGMDDIPLRHQLELEYPLH